MEELVSSQITDSSNRNKIAVIQNWAALEEVEPLPRNENQLLKN